MKYIKKIIGERIYLSPMSVEDAQIYAKWLNDSDVTDGLGATSRVVSIESEKSWLEKNSSDYQFAIVRAADDVLLGNCGIDALKQLDQCASVGIFIGEEENRGKGYGSEALHLLVSFAFDYLNLNNIMLCVFDFNERAIACYEKVGFREIGRRRQSHYVKGKLYDEVFMDILKSELRGHK